MKIKTIKLQNFRCFEKFTAELNEDLTVIVGNNGSGKSTLLDALSIAIGTFLVPFSTGSSITIAKDDALNKCFDLGSVVELQAQYPVEVLAEGVVSDKMLQWKRTLNSEEGRTTVGAAKDLINIAKKLQGQIQKGEKPLLPILSYYGTGRLWAQKRERKTVARTARFNRQMGYIDCLDAASNEKLMLKWFEKMSLQAAASGKIAPELIAVKSAICKCFIGITGYQDVDVQFNFDTHELDIVYLCTDNSHKRYPMKHLSDGYKNTLSMIADIAYRMAVLNPWLLDNVLAETPGVVLIDEIDLHLHPLWQQRIIGDLRSIFPKVQFIVSTHAPIVISSVKKENLLVLQDMQPDGPMIETYGKDANAILLSIMGADERPIAVKKQFNKFYDAMAKEQYDIAEKILKDLQAIIGENDTELNAAQVSLALERM